MEKQKLRFGATFREGLVYAGRNFFPLLGCILLYFLTIWIPYLNIGTMIAMTLLPVQMSKGESINPSHIFNPRYRKYMSEYFILVGIMYAALIASLLFFVIPGIVMAMAWGLSPYFLIEKQKSPIEALRASYRATDGNKWCIFGMFFVSGIIYSILIIISRVFINSVWYYMVYICLFLLYALFSFGIYTSIWKQLKDNVE